MDIDNPDDADSLSYLMDVDPTDVLAQERLLSENQPPTMESFWVKMELNGKDEVRLVADPTFSDAPDTKELKWDRTYVLLDGWKPRAGLWRFGLTLEDINTGGEERELHFRSERFHKTRKVWVPHKTLKYPTFFDIGSGCVMPGQRGRSLESVMEERG